MPHKAIAIVAAMRTELAPLLDKKLGKTLGKTRGQRVDDVELYELPNAVVVVGGIGEKFARRAAEVAVEYAQPKLLLSAGIAGAVSPELKVGDTGRIREVVDALTGTRYLTAGGGDWVLVTGSNVSDAGGKNRLRSRFSADVVDMEAAAVAQVAQERGMPFAAFKSISDDATFAMPPLNRFIDAKGRFDTGRFLLYIAWHPKWWGSLGAIKRNSNLASANLCGALEHLIASEVVSGG
jgi:adenosylhomocysteine nucleosidase